MSKNHHTRFGAFIALAGVVAYVLCLWAPPIVIEYLREAQAFLAWLWIEVFKEQFWQNVLLVVSIWFKKSIVKSIIMAILTPILLVVFLVALFDARDRRRIRAFKAKQVRRAKLWYRYVKGYFYRTFGYYGIFALLISIVTMVWAAFTVSWQVLAWLVSLGPVKQIAMRLYWVVQPLVELIWPYVQIMLRNLYHNVPGVARIVNGVSWLWHRLITGWIPVVSYWQRRIGRRFVRFLVRQRWVRGYLHAQARARIQEIREARRLKTEARMLGIDPDGVPGQGWRGRNYGMRYERNARCVSDRAWARLMLGANLKPTLWEGATVCGRPPV